jgi:hypothetical protein
MGNKINGCCSCSKDQMKREIEQEADLGGAEFNKLKA